MLRLKAMTQPWEHAVTGADQTRMARCADEWGFDMIAVPEHFIIPNEHLELSGPHYLQSTIAQAYLATGRCQPTAQKSADGGRQPCTGRAADVAGDIAGFARAGVAHFFLSFPAPSLSEALDDLRWFASDVRPLVG